MGEYAKELDSYLRRARAAEEKAAATEEQLATCVDVLRQLAQLAPMSRQDSRTIAITTLLAIGVSQTP